MQRLLIALALGAGFFVGPVQAQHYGSGDDRQLPTLIYPSPDGSSATAVRPDGSFSTIYSDAIGSSYLQTPYIGGRQDSYPRRFR